MEIQQQAINALRILSVDAIEKAKSGHPGLPLGAAAFTYQLWAHHMHHSPSHPHWMNRDRFVLSAGHGSMLLYSLLHFFGYGITMDDIKNFRQLHAKTAGHPEYGYAEGIEMTTGPLGAGVATAVGMAMAQEHMAARFNKPGYNLFNNFTYALVGDGCLMEGVASEALSLAGSLKLSKLVVLYDSNDITIEGKTDIAFREQVAKRMEAYGFDVYRIEDGNDLDTFAHVLEKGKLSDKPVFIEIRTQIGYGSPLVGTSKAHSDPMGEENVRQLRENLGWKSDVPFEVDQKVYDHYKAIAAEKEKYYDAWHAMLDKYVQDYPELAKELHEMVHFDVTKLLDDSTFFKQADKPTATRNSSGEILNYVNTLLPNLFGGSADLAPSNKTELKGAGWFGPDNRAGKNIHFGVRENGMAAIVNGIALYGGLKTYGATFFSFVDYFKPMARLASLMQLPVTYVLTHDSIGVGEDGPTHQPIEQLSMLRAQPNMNVFRPADQVETACGWYVALSSTKTPTALILSRQNLKPLASSKEALKGGYIISKAKGQAQGILMGSGSEVSLALDAQAILAQQGIEVDVVSMPCMELFDQQDKAYKDSVLNPSLRKRVAIEAAASQSWYKYVGLDGDVLGLDHFGASGKAEEVFKEFKMTADELVKRYLAL